MRKRLRRVSELTKYSQLNRLCASYFVRFRRVSACARDLKQADKDQSTKVKAQCSAGESIRVFTYFPYSLAATSSGDNRHARKNQSGSYDSSPVPLLTE